jgi:UDP-N-acetylglucosamine acyltransferase
MPFAASATVHPTAVIDPRAEIGDDVRVGPYVVIEGPVSVGPRCVLRTRATLCGPLTLGADNDVGIGAVLGDRGQHLQYLDDTVARTEIGDGNIFREFVTVHRGTAGGVTRVGSKNFLMVNAHIGHDAHVGDGVIMANGALVAGHCRIFDRAFLSGNTAVHQFARVGRLAMLSGVTAATRDLPPFMIMGGRDNIIGINSVGMRRAGMSAKDVAVARETFRTLFRGVLLLRAAAERVAAEHGGHPVAEEILLFLRESKRGVVVGRTAVRSEAEAA